MIDDGIHVGFIQQQNTMHSETAADFILPFEW